MTANLRPTLRVGFVTGATPDKWARAWRERRRERLELVPVTEDEQVEGSATAAWTWRSSGCPSTPTASTASACTTRCRSSSPASSTSSAAVDEVTLDDLADEQLVRPHASGWTPTAAQLDWPPMSEKDAIETVAAGTGVVVVPMSVARLHQRKDVVTRPVTDLEPTTIALVWLRDRDDDVTQAFVGVVRGTPGHELALSQPRATGPAPPRWPPPGSASPSRTRRPRRSRA